MLADNANVFIEGRKFSARQKGLIRQAQDQREPIDWQWRIDFGSLLRQAANGHRIIKAILAGSTPPPNDSLWKAAESRGFEVITHSRSPVTGGAGKQSSGDLISVFLLSCPRRSPGCAF
jgi:hypothetical protein